MAAVKDVKALYTKLHTKWTAKPPNLKECGELLNKLKVSINYAARMSAAMSLLVFSSLV